MNELPNQSSRWPSSSIAINEPSPMAMQPMPSQSPSRSSFSCIGVGLMAKKMAESISTPGSRLQ
jgi:hypothetical protein